MRGFNVLRYLKKWAVPILLVCAAMMAYVFYYAKSNQTYTAQITIQYTNAEAENGLSPNATPIDVTEIYSAAVISDVIAELDMRTTIESIRSCCSVTEIIPEDEETLKKALLEKGEPYEYFPTEYRVALRLGSAYSQGYARRVLDSIINNYLIFYSNNNISSAPVPNNISNASPKQYDYLDCINIIQNSVSEIIDYLKIKTEFSPLYRATSTGYSFSDHSDIYEYAYDHSIPRLYAMAFGRKLTQSCEDLINNLGDSITKASIEMDNLQTKADQIGQLMQVYSDKSKAGFEYHFSPDEHNASDYIIKNVEWRNDIEVTQNTVYDTLVLEYAEVMEAIEENRANIEHYKDQIAIFEGCANTLLTDDSGAKLSGEIEALIESMNAQYSILQKTIAEYNEHQSAQYVTALSSISVSEGINVRMYVLLAFIIFAIVGGGAAIVLGRAADFVDYMLFVNHKLGIANRNKCDKVIEEMSHSLVNDHFVCIALTVGNLMELNTKLGRDSADAVMKRFATSMKELLGKQDFAGYNERGNFIMLLNNCSEEKAGEMMKTLGERDASSAELATVERVRFHFGIAESTAEHCYSVRDLIRIASKRLNGAKEANANE